MNLYPLVKLLSDGQPHSGTELGQKLGISRTAIWKQIQKLPELGLTYRSDKQKGYSLSAPLDLLDPGYLEQALQSSEGLNGCELFFEPVITSTNTFLLDRVNSGEPIHKSLAVAEMQSSGKGRRGKSWFSPFGYSLSCSLGWQFEGSAQELQGMSLAIAVALKNALEGLGIQGIGLKWPNDLYLQDAKLIGVLIEISGDLSGPCQLVVGFGVNVYRPQQLDAECIDQPASFLSDLGSLLPSRNDLVVAMNLAVANVLTRFANDGFQPWQAAWNEAHLWDNKPGWVIAGEHKEAVTLHGVNDQGELRVTLEDGSEKHLNSGEISVRLKA
ncbi:biotin--[acetyl-CoA-carboxylase] ligase [Marinospirillum perlucidum]|uniref:biotin--[acetyl-CoA-carboxylase] ligase n=1 Tax=Marinospirillum perlucidum TaxID=1982602 RepID=UPI000DF2328A|nr:biotin--[acetyl-CoA-carboxylase] ligase [Marinospirillum perlucidum]